MSDTTETVERPYVPTHVLSSEPDEAAKGVPVTPDPAPEGEPATPPAPAEGQPDTDKTEPPADKPEADARRAEQKRIDHLTRQRYAEKARADQAEAARAALEERLRKLENPGQVPQPDIEALVRQRVKDEMQAAETKRQVDGFHAAGQAAFPDWAERCQNLMEMGADKQMAEMLVELPNGAQVAGALADEPAELQRIADLKSERARAIELGKYSARFTAQAAASAVAKQPEAVAKPPLPAPIRPPTGGRARGEPDPNGSMDDYYKWSAGVKWDR